MPRWRGIMLTSLGGHGFGPHGGHHPIFDEGGGSGFPTTLPRVEAVVGFPDLSTSGKGRIHISFLITWRLYFCSSCRHLSFFLFFYEPLGQLVTLGNDLPTLNKGGVDTLPPCFEHSFSYISRHCRLALIWIKFFQLMCFGHILHYTTDHGMFLFTEVGFSWLPWLGHILSCTSHHCNFLLTWVEFFRFTCFGHILSCVAHLGMFLFMQVEFFSTHEPRTNFVMCLSSSFLLRGLGFLDSCVSSIIYLVPLAVVGFLLCISSFLDSHTSSIFYLVSLTMIGFFLYRLSFLTHVS